MNETTHYIVPAYLSIADTAKYTSEGEWQVKELLKAGVYRAKKAGRRTLIEFASIKERLDSLPDAKFAAPRKRATSTARAQEGRAV